MTSETDNDGPSRSQSPEDSGDQENGYAAEHQDMEVVPGNQNKDGQQKKPASSAKDPLRPRRKKARRACHACQRAHLTCGDERPCQRCVKRGLQDACADGVRKKAKYLHDAPNEALMPGGASHFQYINNLQRQQQPSSPTYPLTPVNDIYQRQGAPSYPMFGSSSAATQMSLNDGLITSPGFGTQQSPISAQFQSGSGQPSSMQNLVQSMPQPPPPDPPHGMPSYENNLFDSNELNQYDFDPTAFNFGNHYGALEFGILGQMSSGAAETPPGENGNPLNQNNGNTFTTPGTISTNYSGSPVGSQPYVYGQEQSLGDWRAPTQSQSNVRQSGGPELFSRSRTDSTSNGVIKQEVPQAFPIGIGSAFATPTAGLSPQQIKPLSFDGETNSGKTTFGPSSAPSSRPSTQGGSMVTQGGQAHLQQQGLSSHHQRQPLVNTSGTQNSSRRRGNPCSIYDAVTQPYSYTTGFHSLIAFLKKRLNTPQTLRIAKALASIRPSFISCTKTLGHADLIFMEQCFQRSLWEYENFINLSGTPILICRRTGEIVAVGKEFSILTGWKKDVLLGKEPNLNINTGGTLGAGSGGTGVPSRGGLNTPRVPEGALDTTRPQPAFLAELLDDDSVIEFYEDFARLAFGDPKGVITRSCKLLKYRSRDDEEVGEDGRLKSRKRKRSRLQGRGEIAGEAGIDELGDEDGKVESMCCWTVKRDLFDLPMMIVMNFLPCI